MDDVPAWWSQRGIQPAAKRHKSGIKIQQKMVSRSRSNKYERRAWMMRLVRPLTGPACKQARQSSSSSRERVRQKDAAKQG
jgi:hypothetical protein